MDTYAAVDWNGTVPPPPPALNGGWYTGQPFKAGAPWATVPVVPDWSLMLQHTLRLADVPPPPQAFWQYAASHRPGNNYCPNPGASVYQDAETGFAVCGGRRTC